MTGPDGVYDGLPESMREFLAPRAERRGDSTVARIAGIIGRSNPQYFDHSFLHYAEHREALAGILGAWRPGSDVHDRGLEWWRTTALDRAGDIPGPSDGYATAICEMILHIAWDSAERYEEDGWTDESFATCIGSLTKIAQGIGGYVETKHGSGVYREVVSRDTLLYLGTASLNMLHNDRPETCAALAILTGLAVSAAQREPDDADDRQHPVAHFLHQHGRGDRAWDIFVNNTDEEMVAPVSVPQDKQPRRWRWRRRRLH